MGAERGLWGREDVDIIECRDLWHNPYPTTPRIPDVVRAKRFHRFGPANELAATGGNSDETTPLRVGRQHQAETDWRQWTPSLGSPAESAGTDFYREITTDRIASGCPPRMR